MSFGRILIAVDASDVASRALDVGMELARLSSAKIALVHAVDGASSDASDDPVFISETAADEERAGRALLDRLAARVGAGTETFLVRGAAPAAIVATADRWKAETIVMGTHGRGGLSRVVFGSVAEGAVRGAHCPVLVVPARS